MPPVTPFRPPSSRRNVNSTAGPQFASTPRFLLSQRGHHSIKAKNKEKDDIDVDVDGSGNDDVLPYSTPVATGRQNQNQFSSGRKEVIEDSEDEGYEDETVEPAHNAPTTHVNFNTHEEGEGEGEGSPGFAGEIEAQFDALFGSPVDRNKRRRIELNAETPVATRGRKPWDDGDRILSSSPEEQAQGNFQSLDDCLSPLPPRGMTEEVHTANPKHVPAPAPTATQPSTPGTVKKGTGFRGHPRFMLSGTPQISSTSSSSQIPPASTPASTSRRKPAFVIPRSPSPSRVQEDTSIPTPFSPSSKTLNRRGRRANTPAYLPGGMAASVRSWILELGTKRENMENNSPRHLQGDSEGTFDLKRYFLVVRVKRARQAALSSSGPVAFVQGQPMAEDESAESENILLLGPPRSKMPKLQLPSGHIPQLRSDNLIGIHRGLVWEINLNEQLPEELEYDITPEQIESHAPGVKKWLVGMEWDILQ